MKLLGLLNKGGKNDGNDKDSDDGTGIPVEQTASAPSTSSLNYKSVDPSDQAELSILSNLEAQSKNSTAGSDGFRPAIPGERVPLSVDSLGSALDDPNAGKDSPSVKKKPKPSFKQMARKVHLLQTLNKGATGHRRIQSLLASIDDPEMTASKRQSEAGLLPPTDVLEGLQFMWDEGQQSPVNEEREEADGPEETPVASEAALANEQTEPSERNPLLGGNNKQQLGTPRAAAYLVGQIRLAQQKRSQMWWRRMKRRLNPVLLMKRLFAWFMQSTFLAVIPLVIMSWVLIRYLGNPELEFLPGNITFSWCFDFMWRQLVVLELARFTQYILIDLCVMSSRWMVKILGPWITIFFLQSRGWPFLLSCWGFYDLLFFQGANTFQTHWIHWSELDVSGNNALPIDFYIRGLIAMIVVGLTTTVKRTLLTLYFGKRSFDMYKQRLEELLSQIILITELAELAAEADILSETKEGEASGPGSVTDPLKRPAATGSAQWSSLRFQDDKKPPTRSSSTASLAEENSIKEAMLDQVSLSPGEKPRQTLRAAPTAMKQEELNTSGLFRLKNLLDRWEEPVNKLDKHDGSTVNDILKFRKALTYMDLEYPFSEAFGPASTRDELLSSAEQLYRRLLKLTPGSSVLPYSILAVLTENDDGTIDRGTEKSIADIFRANGAKEITLLSFVQTCDYIYRKLRYFRASVGNSSVLDKVLESIINVFFVFGLTMVTLAILDLNPWPLLVSISTLLLTIALAIGPAAIRALEGIFLIVGTRPYDIGDRIMITDSAGGAPAGFDRSWFVEDITLFSTTLRLGSNNEVAIINNGCIAGARITNCARSKNAIVIISMKLNIKFHDGDNVAKFKEAIGDYIKSNPEIWDSIVFIRCDDIDTGYAFVMYKIAVRSRHTWQASGRVLTDRGRLHQYCAEVATKMGVAYDLVWLRKSGEGESNEKKPNSPERPKEGDSYSLPNTFLTTLQNENREIAEGTAGQPLGPISENPQIVVEENSSQDILMPP